MAIEKLTKIQPMCKHCSNEDECRRLFAKKVVVNYNTQSKNCHFPESELKKLDVENWNEI